MIQEKLLNFHSNVCYTAKHFVLPHRKGTENVKQWHWFKFNQTIKKNMIFEQSITSTECRTQLQLLGQWKNTYQGFLGNDIIIFYSSTLNNFRIRVWAWINFRWPSILNSHSAFWILHLLFFDIDRSQRNTWRNWTHLEGWVACAEILQVTMKKQPINRQKKTIGTLVKIIIEILWLFFNNDI